MIRLGAIAGSSSAICLIRAALFVPFSYQLNSLADRAFIYQLVADVLVQNARNERLIGKTLSFSPPLHLLQIILTDPDVDVTALSAVRKYLLYTTTFFAVYRHEPVCVIFDLLLEVVKSRGSHLSRRSFSAFQRITRPRCYQAYTMSIPDEPGWLTNEPLAGVIALASDWRSNSANRRGRRPMISCGSLTSAYRAVRPQAAPDAPPAPAGSVAGAGRQDYGTVIWWR